MTVANIDDHLDEVLGIIEKPKKEIVKVEKVKPIKQGKRGIFSRGHATIIENETWILGLSFKRWKDCS